MGDEEGGAEIYREVLKKNVIELPSMKLATQLDTFYDDLHMLISHHFDL